MRDEITAEGLQYLPDDGAEGRAGPQLPPGDLARGAEPEAEPEQPEVQHQRYRVEQHGLADARQDTAGAGRDTGNDRGADEAHPDHDDQPGTAQPGPREPWAAGEGDLPRRVERVLQRVRHPQRPDEDSYRGDDKRDPLLAQVADAPLELRADDGVLVHRGRQHLVLQLGIILEHDVQHGYQEKQQREDRDQAGVRDQGGQVARLVVAELLPHRDREGQPGVLLLVLVHGPEEPFQPVHREKNVPRAQRIHPPESRLRYRRPSPYCGRCATDRCYKLSAMSSGRMQPWAGSLVPGGTGGLVAGLGVAVAEEAGEVSGGDEEAGLVAVPEDGADGGPDA